MARPKSTPAATATSEAPETELQEAAFRRFAAPAKALAAEKVKIRGDTQLALDNALAGVRNVLERRADLAKSWPAARIEALAEVVPLAKAAVFAAAQAELAGMAPGVQARILEAYTLRDMLLSALTTCAKFGVLGAEVIAKFQEGRGPLASAQGLVDLAAYWRKNDAVLAHRTPATPAHLDRAEKLGNQLVVEIRRTGAAKEKDPAVVAAAELANRYWTLLALAYLEVHKAGMELWGPEYVKHVPALLARVGAAKKKAEKDGGAREEDEKAPEAEDKAPGA